MWSFDLDYKMPEDSTYQGSDFQNTLVLVAENGVDARRITSFYYLYRWISTL